MQKLVKALSLIILLASCAREVVEPAQQIAGRYALDNGTGLTNQYLEFDKGTLRTYKASDSYPLAENQIWDNGGRAFSVDQEMAYYIQQGQIHTNGGNKAIAWDEERLTLGTDSYIRLDGFKEQPYSVIQAEQAGYEIPLQEETHSFPVAVENPIPAGTLTVSSKDSWISELTYKDGVVLYKASTTKEPRTGTITLKYTHARDVVVSISQKPATFIRLSETSKTIDYVSALVEIPYTIEGPVEGSELNVTTSENWAKTISIQGDKVVVNIPENNSGSRRSATLTFSYEGAEDVAYSLTQEWSASSIVLTPAAATPSYASGTGTFTFSIQNPRDGISCTAASQANWITEVAISGSSVSYKVAENNSGASRTGKIKLTYGNFATAEFTVTQAWSASTIILTPDSAQFDYTAGTGSFSFEVQNPGTSVLY